MKRRPASGLFAGVAAMLLVAACGGSTSSTPDPTTTVPESTNAAVLRGFDLFQTSCMACHGPGGVGVEGLGKPLTTSTFAVERTDQELLAFIIEGRPADDPLNTTGIAMPPKGGNVTFSDADLLDIIAYVRTLNG